MINSHCPNIIHIYLHLTDQFCIELTVISWMIFPNIWFSVNLIAVEQNYDQIDTEKCQKFVANRKQLQEDRCIWSIKERNLSRLAWRSFRKQSPRYPNHCATSNLSTKSWCSGKIDFIVLCNLDANIFLFFFFHLYSNHTINNHHHNNTRT